MSGHGLILALVLLLGSFNNGCSADMGRSLSGDIEAAVKDLLGKIAKNPLVNPAYELDHVVFHIQSGGTNLTGGLDGDVKGIPDTELTKNKFTVIGMKHTVGLNIPRLYATGDYSLKGVVAGLLFINGAGPFLIELENLSADIVVSVKAANRLPALELKDVTLALKLGKFHVNIENILGDLSDSFNKMINAIAPEVIAIYQPRIEALLTDILYQLINGLLSGAGGEVDPPRFGAWGEVDLSEVSATFGEFVNHLITAGAWAGVGKMTVPRV